MSCLNEGRLLRNLMKSSTLCDVLKEEKHRDEEYLKSTMWFHGKAVNRKRAESLLLEENKEGIFLVRESYSCPGDYVLSVCLGGKKVEHFKIEKNEADAYYKMETSKDLYTHGLDALIQHHRTQAHGLPAKLTSFVRGQPPPAASVEKGRTNILHLAIATGNVELVHKILKEKNCPNVDYKNEKGSTALHVATLNGNCDIIRLLLKKGASPNIKDEEGYTALQVACKREGNRSAVHLLLTEGGSSPVDRTMKCGWTALHVAASLGNAECVAELLQHEVPCRPRDRLHRTPYELACEHHHEQVLHMLDSHVCAPAQLSKDDWFHLQLSRKAAEKVLADHNQRDGLFLVRRSSKNPDNYAISLCHEQIIYHYEVKSLDNAIFFIDDSPFMPSIEHLIEHFCQYADGLSCALKVAVRPDNTLKAMKLKPPLQQANSGALLNLSCQATPGLISMPPRVIADCYDEISESLTNTATKLGTSVALRTPVIDAPLRQHQNDSVSGLSLEQAKMSTALPMFAAEDVVLENELGQGEFGSVMKGYVLKRGAQGVKKEAAAVKTLHDDHIQQAEFLQEAHVMFALDHPNIVKLIGICEGPPVMIIQELVACGSMLDYLWDYPTKVNIQTDLYLWAAQIALGMMYLEEKGFIHRDLAARNILLESKTLAKISDFGLSRAINAHSDYYKASKGGRWPVKWYAPESINYGTFSHASDVWSYGVTLYEMFSLGEQPYGEMSGAQVLSWLERGGRLSTPDRCPDHVYALMLRCWSSKPSDRPTFRSLHEHFNTHPAFASIRALVRQANIRS